MRENDEKSFFLLIFDNLPIVEKVLEKNIFTYNIDIKDESSVSKLTRISIGRCEKTMNLLRYNNNLTFSIVFNSQLAILIYHITSTVNFCYAKITSKHLPQNYFYSKRCYLKNWMGSIMRIPKSKLHCKTCNLRADRRRKLLKP